MKLLWLCNAEPGVVKAHISGKPSGAVNWIDHVLSDLRQLGFELRILCRGVEAEGVIDERCSYRCFGIGKDYEYRPDLEKQFQEELGTFRPDVIHSWGTEYAHTLAMVNAAEQCGLLEHMVISIQGLCSVIARHYCEGLPCEVRRRSTFRDAVRRDNILQQQRKFALRGELEVAALKKACHVIGRTDWDEACVRQINPRIVYHFCNETLRDPFYEDRWHYETCRKHRVFASSCAYPVKGFHYLLEAFGQVVQDYPDARLAVTGRTFFTPDTGKGRLRQSSYSLYLTELAKKYHLEDKLDFLGSLDPEQMKQAFLAANVFALPSTIENSPNSLGEAMLLGVPCVAADVGGVKNLMTHGKEGFVYQSTAPYMLAYHIRQVFAMEDRAEAMGQKAREHARNTHDPEKNLRDLIGIYEKLCN